MKQRGTASSPAPASGRLRLGLGSKEAAVLLLYIAMIAIAVAFYQQSQDEGREWIIARSFAIPHIVFHVLHYEGHPPLMYLLLWAPAHLHMPYTWTNWISALLGASSVYLLLRLSPFPFIIRALLPFCFALGYQEAVVARSYVLFPLLAFLAAHLYRSTPPRPLAFYVSLALLANVSFHGTLVSAGLAIAYAVRLRREHSSRDPAILEPALRPRVLWSAGAIFLTSLLFVFICIYPAKYNGMTPGQAIGRIVHRMQGPHAPSSAATDAPSVQAARSGSPVANPPVSRAGFLRRHADLLWLVFVYPVSSLTLLSCAFQVLVLVYLCSQGQWELILPIVLLDYFLLFGFVAYRHTPLVWITLITVLWAAWSAPPRASAARLRQAVTFMVALLCVLQVPWTVAAIHYELRHATYPAKATAAYLNTLPPGTGIDGDASVYAVLPYLPNLLPPDHGNGRFADHASTATFATVDDLVTGPPKVLLLNSLLGVTGAVGKLHDAGYSETRTFCGGPYFPNAPPSVSCFHVFVKR